MSAYPKNLSYAVRRMSNYSCNQVKILPLNATTASANGSLVFRLPNTGIIDLDSWMVFFNAATTNGTDFTGLPGNIESLIESVMVTINGQVVQQPFNDYGSLFNYKVNQTVDEARQKSRAILQGGYRITALPTNSSQPAQRFCWAEWLGFLGECQPRYIVADLLGDIEITIRLKPAEVLTSGADGNTTCTYNLTDIFGSINICQIQDGVFNQALMARLSETDEAGQEVPISIPYKQYYYFTETSTNGAKNMKFSVASQSIDAVHHTNALSTLVTTVGGRNGAANIPDTTGAENSAYYHFTGGGESQMYLQVNGSNYPSFNVSEAIMTYAYSQHALGSLHDVNSGAYATLALIGDTVTGGTADMINAASQFIDGRWYWTYSFEHNSDDDRLISGMNTFGSNQQMYYNATDDGTAAQAQFSLLFVESSPTLNALSGKRLAVTA